MVAEAEAVVADAARRGRGQLAPSPARAEPHDAATWLPLPEPGRAPAGHRAPRGAPRPAPPADQRRRTGTCPAPRVLGVAAARGASPCSAAAGSATQLTRPRAARRSRSSSTAPASDDAHRASTPSARCSQAQHVTLGAGDVVVPAARSGAARRPPRRRAARVPRHRRRRRHRAHRAHGRDQRRRTCAKQLEAGQAHRGAQQPRPPRTPAPTSCSARASAASLDGRQPDGHVRLAVAHRRRAARSRTTCTLVGDDYVDARARHRARRRRRRSRSCASAPTTTQTTRADPVRHRAAGRPDAPDRPDPRAPGRQGRHHDRHLPPADRERRRRASDQVVSKVPTVEPVPKIIGYGTLRRLALGRARASASRAAAGTPSTPTPTATTAASASTRSTWQAFGGREFAPNAGLATREEQIIVGQRIYDKLRLGPVGLREQRARTGRSGACDRPGRADADLVAFHVPMALLTPATVHALLDEHGLRPKQSLGQNFLADPEHRAPRRRARRRAAAATACSRSAPASARSRSRCSTPAHDVVALELDAALARRAARRCSTRRSARLDAVDVRVGDALHGRPRRAARRQRRRGRACRTCRTTSRCRWSCGCSRRRRPSTRIAGDGAARGGGAPRRRARRPAVRRGVGEGRVLRRGARWSALVPPTVFVPRPKVDSALVRLRRRAAPPVTCRRPTRCSRSCAPGSRSGARCCAASLRAGARRRARRRCSSRAGVAPTARAEALGLDEWAAVARERGGGRMRLARVRATAYPKLTLSLRVLGRRADGFHDLERWSSRSASRTTCSRRTRCPRPAACRSRWSGDEVGERRARPTTATSRSSPAEKLLVRAGRSGHGVRLVLRKQIPAGGGLGGGSADAAAALLAVRQLLDVDIDDDGVLAIAAEVGSDVPFCVRGGAAWMRGRGEVIEPVSLAAPGSRSSSRSRRSGCRRPTCTGRGTSSAARDATRSCPRRDGVAPLLPELVNDLEPAAEARRAAPGRVPRRARGRRPARRRCSPGSGSAYVVPVADARRRCRRSSTR